jgi:protein TonB
MNSLVYALNIATLALWVGLTGLDVVGWVMPIWHAEPKSARAGETVAVLKHPEISLGTPETSPAEAQPAAPPAAATPAAQPELLPVPPQLPEIAEFAPLPEVPEWPATRPAPAAPKRPSAKPTPRAEEQPPGRAAAAAGGGGSGSGLSPAARLAAGQMPSPNYPADARRKGQAGTVLVEFVVGTDGRVLSAYPKQPSPWPLLNNEAVRTVRRWIFPPGAVMKLQRPIIFQLK